MCSVITDTDSSLSSVADPGKGPGGPALPLRLVQTEAQRAEKFLFWRPPPPPVISGLDPTLKLTKTVICFQFHPSHHLVSLHVLSGAGCWKGVFVHPPD